VLFYKIFSILNKQKIFFLVKAYVQKGNILVVLKEPSKAMSAYTKAIELEPDCQVNKFSQFYIEILNYYYYYQ